MIVEIDPWYDLVYHVLSHLPVRAEDASNVFDPQYVSWAEIEFEKRGIANNEVDRTLLQDAELMASLYDETGNGCLLHSFPLLWNSTAAFSAVMTEEFHALLWEHDHTLQLSRTISSEVNATLVELFRTALWSELKNGYLEMHAAASGPPARSYLNDFSLLLESIKDRLPGLSEFRWVLCHPLRKHGRLLSLEDAQPVIVVGVADPLFGVSRSYPIVQGCHEYFVSVASSQTEQAEFSTVPGEDGYNYFSLIEDQALVHGARFFMESPWQKEYLEWLSNLYPDDPEGATGELIRAST